MPVRVVDGASGEPVVHARVSVIAQQEGYFGSMADARTEADGMAVLGPIPKSLTEAGPMTVSTFPLDHPILAVEHPGYGHHSQPFPVNGPLLREASTEGVTVTLWPPSALRGTVRWGDVAPSQRYAVTLERSPSRGREEESFNEAPRGTVTHADGSFEVSGLAVGSYTLSLAEPLFSVDFLQRVTERRRPSIDYRQSIEIRSGVENTVDIQLSAAGVAAPGWVEGRVLMNGQPLVGAEVSVSSSTVEVFLTDANGSFVTQPTDRARVSVRVSARLGGASGSSEAARIHDGVVPISHGRANLFELRLITHDLNVTVRDAATGEPMEGVVVHSEARLGSGSTLFTDENGEVTLTLQGGKSTKVSAYLRGIPPMLVPLSAAELESGQPLVISFERGVPCGGRVILPEGLEFGVSCGVTLARNGEELSPTLAYLIIEKGSRTFTKRGLAPGSYTASLVAEGRVPTPVTFELPKDGATDLLLDFKSGTSR